MKTELSMANNGATRQDKIDWFMAEFEAFFKKKPEGVISKDKLISAFILENNSTDRTAKEILKSLEIRGVIQINGDDITK